MYKVCGSYLEGWMAERTNMRMMMSREEGGKGGGHEAGLVMSQWKAWQRPSE